MSRVATEVLHGVQRASQILKPLRPQPNPCAKIRPDFLATIPIDLSLQTMGVNPAGLASGYHLGSSTPGMIVQIAYAEACEATVPIWDEHAIKLRDFDGSLDYLHKTDHVKGRHILNATELQKPSFFFLKSLLNNTPTVQQQAALNLGVMVFNGRNPGNEFGIVAQRLSKGVGSRWDNLLTCGISPLGLSTFYAQSGLIHLYEDVPTECRLYLEDIIREVGTEDPTAILEAVEKLGGAGELAKASALGALKGTSYFIKCLEEEASGIYQSGPMTMPAKMFFDPTILESAIEVRNRYILESLAEVIPHKLRPILSTEKVKGAFDSGAQQAQQDANDVAEYANATSQKLAEGNIESAHQRIDEE